MSKKWPRLILVTGIVLILGLVVADLLLVRMLTTRLPALLADGLERPVAVQEIQVDLLRLRATAAELVIGQQDQPAVMAEDVSVELDFAALLGGSVRLSEVGADYLSINALAWRAATDDEPVDRALINRWVPQTAEVGTFALFNGETLLFVNEDIMWSRLASGDNQLVWTQAGVGELVVVSAQVSPLFELLDQERVRLHLEVHRVANGERVLSASWQSDPLASAVSQRLELESRAITGRWRFETADLFSWPEHSVADLSLVDVDMLQRLWDAGTADQVRPTRDWLQAPLPELSLPTHRLELRVAELTMNNESFSQIDAEVELVAEHQGRSARARVNRLELQTQIAKLNGQLDASFGPSWHIAADLNGAAQAADVGVAVGGYGGDRRRWRQGTISLRSEGDTLLALLGNASGTVAGQGSYLGRAALPMTLRADFRQAQGLRGADGIEISIGSSSMRGSVWMDESRTKLDAKFGAGRLDLDELDVWPEDTDPQTDWVLPDIRWLPFELPIDIEVSAAALVARGQHYRDVSARIEHRETSAALALSLAIGSRGQAALAISATRNQTERTLDLDVRVTDADLAALGLAGTLDNFQLKLLGAGSNLAAAVGDMEGGLAATIDGLARGRVEIEALPKLVTDADRLGEVQFNELQLNELQVSVAELARIDGQVAYNVADKKLFGHLRTPSIDLDALAIPSAEDASSAQVVLNVPVTIDLDLSAAQIARGDLIFKNVALDLEGLGQQVLFNSYQADTPFGLLQGAGQLTVHDSQATLKLVGQVQGLNLGALGVQQLQGVVRNPIAGAYAVAGEGGQWATLFDSLTLDLDLAEQNADRAEAFAVSAMIRQREGGVFAELRELRIRGSDARGELSYANLGVPTLNAELISDVVDLRAWLAGPDEQAGAQPTQGFVRTLSNATRSTLGVLSSAVTGSVSGLRPQAKGDGFFDPTPWSAASLSGYELVIDWQAEQVYGDRGFAQQVRLDADVADTHLLLDLRSAEANGGVLEIQVDADAGVDPPRVDIQAVLDNVRPDLQPERAPLTAFINLSGDGSSEAKLASTLTGQVYLASGRGTTQYGSLGVGLMTGDLIQSVLGRLLPGGERVERVSCAVGYAEINQGKIETPAALVMRTPKANILIRAQADLGAETIRAQFDSASITGAGISVGNVLSSTVQLQGKLSAPKIVPSTTRLLWRYGAALATGGLSLLGESVFKRVMADRDPCGTLTATIRAQVCPNETPAAASALVCPAVDSG